MWQNYNLCVCVCTCACMYVCVCEPQKSLQTRELRVSTVINISSGKGVLVRGSDKGNHEILVVKEASLWRYL